MAGRNSRSASAHDVAGGGFKPGLAREGDVSRRPVRGYALVATLSE
jgi:hypothetical protein